MQCNLSILPIFCFDFTLRQKISNRIQSFSHVYTILIWRLNTQKQEARLAHKILSIQFVLCLVIVYVTSADKYIPTPPKISLLEYGKCCKCSADISSGLIQTVTFSVGRHTQLRVGSLGIRVSKKDFDISELL